MTYLKNLTESCSSLVFIGFFIKYIVDAKLKQKLNEIKVLIILLMYLV